MQENVDHAEIDKFNALASRWWDPAGESGPLHHINPARFEFINNQSGLSAGHSITGMRALDMGCGGGILTEKLARAGLTTTGIDMGDAPLKVARLHALESDLAIHYEKSTAEAYADSHAGQFDIVCCMELLEHVPDPGSVVAACAKLIQPQGQLFFSTINRNPKAWLTTVLGAEYVMNLLPKGTHNYEKFITPAELAGYCRAAGLTVKALSGISYNPLAKTARLTRHGDVNYLLHATRGRI